MKRSFLLNIIFLLFVNLLIKPFYVFGIDRTVQNRVGFEEYGLYASLLSFTFLFQIINDFGIQNFNNRNIAQHRQLLSKYFPNILILKFGFAIIYTLITLIVAFLLGYQIRHFHLLLFFIFNQILIAAIQFFQSNISGLGLYRTYSLSTIMDRLLLIGICSLLLWGELLDQVFKIEWFIYAQTLSLSITAITCFVLVFRKISKFQLKFKPAFLFLILKKSYPFALAIFLMTVYTRIDFVMIERLLPNGEKEAGIYASAYRLLEAANSLGLLFAGLLLPMTAKLLKEKKPIQGLLRLSLKMILSIAITFALTSIFFREEIMFLLYKEASTYSADVLAVLMATFIIISGTYIYSTLLTANNSLGKLNKIFGICVGLNVLLNVFLIPQYGALGAAYTTFMTQSFAFICQILIAKKVFKLNENYGLIFRFSFLGGLLALFYYTSLAYLDIPWGLHFMLMLAVGMGFSFLLGLIKVKEGIAIIRHQ